MSFHVAPLQEPTKVLQKEVAAPVPAKVEIKLPVAAQSSEVSTAGNSKLKEASSFLKPPAAPLLSKPTEEAAEKPSLFGKPAQAPEQTSLFGAPSGKATESKSLFAPATSETKEAAKPSLFAAPKADTDTKPASLFETIKKKDESNDEEPAEELGAPLSLFKAKSSIPEAVVPQPPS